MVLKATNSPRHADDGFLLTHTEEESHSIREVQKVAGEYGLQINEEKSKVIMIIEKNQPENIENIQVGNITYLGVEIRTNIVMQNLRNKD